MKTSITQGAAPYAAPRSKRRQLSRAEQALRDEWAREARK